MELQYFTTVSSAGKCVRQSQRIVFKPDSGIENQVVNLYPQFTDQVFEGFGGAFTDSAGYVFSRMGAKARFTLSRTDSVCWYCR